MTDKPRVTRRRRYGEVLRVVSEILYPFPAVQLVAARARSRFEAEIVLIVGFPGEPVLRKRRRP